MTLREQLILAGIIKPANSAAQSETRRPPDVTGTVLPSDMPKQVKPAAKKAAKTTPSRKRQEPYRNWTLEEKLAARAAEKHKPSPLCCPLCGEVVPKGGMLDHKAQRHNEKAIVPSPARITHPPSHPIFVQGGSPGLKKR